MQITSKESQTTPMLKPKKIKDGLTLISWEELSKKIKIRQITIMEIDSTELYEELKNNKVIRNKMSKEITNAFELNAENITSVKRQLEKKNYFCVLEEK